MTDRSFDRAAAAGGIAFTVLAFASAAAAPLPTADAPAEEIRRFLSDHGVGFGLGAALMAVAVVGGGLFFGYVHRRLAASDPGTSLPSCFLVAAGGVITVALLGALLQGVLARVGVGVDDPALLALWGTWNVVAFTGPPLFCTVVLLLPALRTLRTEVFPRWSAWVAIVAGVCGLVTALIGLGTPMRPPVLLDFGSFLLTSVWVTGLAVHGLVRTTDTADQVRAS